MNVAQPNISRDLQYLQRQATSYIYSLASGTIASRFKEAEDGILLAKARAWNLFDDLDRSDDIEPAVKVNLKTALLKVVLASEESRYRILMDSESILNLESLNNSVSEIERLYRQAYR